MRFFHDWEFIENGSTVCPISVGVVAETGERYYAVFSEMPVGRIKMHPWLMENVWPHLPTERVGKFVYLNRTHADVRPTERIRDEVRNFIASFGEHRDQHELWAWYGAYDHLCLSQLYGRMIDLPDEVPMVTHDITTLYAMTGAAPPKRHDREERPEHHALADALWDRTLFQRALSELASRSVLEGDLWTWATRHEVDG